MNYQVYSDLGLVPKLNPMPKTKSNYKKNLHATVKSKNKFTCHNGIVIEDLRHLNLGVRIDNKEFSRVTMFYSSAHGCLLNTSSMHLDVLNASYYLIELKIMIQALAEANKFLTENKK